MEQIYTIPVTEAVDASVTDPKCGCPVCTMSRRLEYRQLELILGPSMMEPAIRQMTNREGFCLDHYRKLLTRKNRLGVALILESHLLTLLDDMEDPSLAALTGKRGDRAVSRIGELEGSCYLCSRIEESLSRMIDTFVLLWHSDPDFRRKVEAQPHFCLPHYRRLLTVGKQKLSKKEYQTFLDTLTAIEKPYLNKLREDVSWFCKKYDYRYGDEPWYDAKDSIERTVATLHAQEGRDPEHDR